MGSSTVKCAESIALLHLLHSVPSKPFSNPSTCPQRHSTNKYSLSFEAERELAGTLAFLSSIKDEPKRIPAVCLHEDTETKSLSVLVAVNEAKHHDGLQALNAIKLGFENIFLLLSKASQNQNIHGDVFDAIIVMCSQKILSRLRLVCVKRKRDRKPLKPLLQDATRLLSQLSKPLEKSLKELTGLVDSWSKHQTPKRLGDVVEGVYRLSQVDVLPRLINSMTNSQMDPSCKSNLLNIIKKVSRYREATLYLCHMAKKNAFVRNMKVVLVSLPQSAFHLVPPTQSSPALLSTLDRMHLAKTPEEVKQLCHLLESTELKASERFASHLGKALTEAKIHAEVQLIFYCDTNWLLPPPRVVCSSKDACFLCNTFILMHGKFHTPRCHAKIYTGWRLPAFPDQNGIENQLTKTLDAYISTSIKHLRSGKKRIVHPDPNESTVLTLLGSTSTLNTLNRNCMRSRVGSQTPSTLSISRLVRITQEAAEPVVEPSPASTIVQLNKKMNKNMEDRKKTEARPATTDHPELKLHTTPYPAEVTALTQGQVFSSVIKPNSSSKFHEASPLKIRVEYASKAIPNEKPHTQRRVLSYHMEWLSLKDAEMVPNQKNVRIIDADLLGDEITLTEQDIKGLYIKAGGTWMKIRLVRKMDTSEGNN